MVSEERPEGVTSHSIGAPLDGERLDRVVSMLWDCSRSEASTLIAAGEVRLDDEVVTTKSRRVVAGDAIELRVAAPTGPALPLPQGDLELDVVDEDESIIVIDKAAGMVVHPAPGHPDGTTSATAGAFWRNSPRSASLNGLASCTASTATRQA